jgi:hypothetical protein
MDLGLQEQFNRLEAQRQRAVSAAAALPETDRVLAMPGSAWSPAQVLTHCVMAEQEFLRRMASTAESGTGGLTPTRSPLFGAALLLMRFPLVAVPAPESMIPAADASLESAARGWDLVRSDLRGWLESVDDPSRTVLCVHPIFGALSAKQVLTVMEAHGTYHAKRDVARWERLAARS